MKRNALRSLSSEAVREQERTAPRPLRSQVVWVIEPPGGRPQLRLREIWQSRHLLRYFAFRTLYRTYRKTALGWIWLILRPLIPVLITTLVFHQLAGVQSGTIPYFYFALVGNSIWGFFEEGVTWVTRSLQINKSVLTKVYFPRIIVPIAALSPAFIHLLIYLGLIIAIDVYYAVDVGELYIKGGLHLLFAAFSVLLTTCLILGIGFITSVLGAEYRDIRFTLGYIFRFWYFLTPIVYPIDLVPHQWRWLAAVNPMTTIAELFKLGTFGGQFTVDIKHIALTIVIICFIFILGLLFFLKSEASSIDRL